ncbi:MULTISPECIES: polysaccharide biosynthesis/export family protein [unclassified Beijerinckia]|uniref:polysaccharide biosynthesis/export family protein n=1 Tax=unclassified Beijerinckia TaxID=2638183 RepID=UPI0008984D70|nr:MULTISPECIES: polysaccharide biosynthesis/export family protein [unclassified Beijerinckia]SEC30979.1 polysaccharide export outer membrane protein [Beijerinckia sp. 28-YEA-48]
MRVFCLLVVAVSLAGCANPVAGPSAEEVMVQATAQAVTADGQAAGLVTRYELVDVSDPVLSILARRGPDSLRSSFGDYRPSAEPTIGVGDYISVTIWEAAPGGLFSGPAVLGPVNAGSKSATMPDQPVGRDGSITVPYAGRIRVAGQYPRNVEKTVEQALEGKAIQPQVIVNVTRPVSSSVTITGEVAGGARIPLTVRGDKVLDVIATAGGLRGPSYETFVQLTRGNRTARVPFTRVMNDPRENIYLRADDVLAVLREPQYFMAVGATGANAQVPFEAGGMTLSQAIAKVGGLQDFRADPKGVFIFRYEPDNIARMLRPNSSLLGQGAVPVVYRIDMSDANNIFLAQRFPMFHRDVLYISNSPNYDSRKTLDMINAAMMPFANLASVASSGAAVYNITKK